MTVAYRWKLAKLIKQGAKLEHSQATHAEVTKFTDSVIRYEKSAYGGQSTLKQVDVVRLMGDPSLVPSNAQTLSNANDRLADLKQKPIPKIGWIDHHQDTLAVTADSAALLFLAVSVI